MRFGVRPESATAAWAAGVRVARPPLRRGGRAVMLRIATPHDAGSIPARAFKESQPTRCGARLLTAAGA